MNQKTAKLLRQVHRFDKQMNYENMKKFWHSMNHWERGFFSGKMKMFLREFFSGKMKMFMPRKTAAAIPSALRESLQPDVLSVSPHAEPEGLPIASRP